jgi:hypothetical protein
VALYMHLIKLCCGVIVNRSHKENKGYGGALGGVIVICIKRSDVKRHD